MSEHRGLFRIPGISLRAVFAAAAGCIVLIAALLAWKTWADLRPFPESLTPWTSEVRKVKVLDRYGAPLSVTYSNEWNIHDFVPLHEIPPLLQNAFVESEDRRFFSHGGADWRARLHALFQNLTALRIVRGASTITEQAVRMLHPRPRTFWSRWLEGIEATLLERRFCKADILEFYLNQVPYAHRRRGVVQAARLYFDRDPDTLNPRETLALAVLVRAPSSLDLRRRPNGPNDAVSRLASSMLRHGRITEDEYRSALTSRVSLAESKLPVDAGHFVQHVYRSGVAEGKAFHGGLTTTLDSSLQRRVQEILDTRLADLKESEVGDGAALVVDHKTGEVLAWVNGGGLSGAQPGGWIDAITTPRQPGSTLKPFLYALALERGWTPATIIDDSPMAEPIGTGLHSFHNYSRRHYGPLRLREALGNSLNIPAVRTIRFTGTESFLNLLHALGFDSLTQSHDFYGQGLALGDGEITLFELVQAYTVIARRGEFRPLMFTPASDEQADRPAKRIFSEETSSLIADILSDPQARRREFGQSHLLRLPVQTAAKTGTSSDHKDSWVVGFSHRHTVGVWMGNLDRRPTNGVTGSIGPALALRAVFAELNRMCEAEPLHMSPQLTSASICAVSGLLAGPGCPEVKEWFAAKSAPSESCGLHSEKKPARTRVALDGSKASKPKLERPTPGLLIAMDPRVPNELEAFAFALPADLKPRKTEWLVDGQVAGTTGPDRNRFLWPLSPGEHLAAARIWRSDDPEPEETPPVRFTVR